MFLKSVTREDSFPSNEVSFKKIKTSSSLFSQNRSLGGSSHISSAMIEEDVPSYHLDDSIGLLNLDDNSNDRGNGDR